LAAVRAKIIDLQRMEAALVELLGRCSGEATPDCSMLEALFDA
jgi:MerR family mercuric resistance operon transcriptional regulator